MVQKLLFFCSKLLFRPERLEFNKVDLFQMCMVDSRGHVSVDVVLVENTCPASSSNGIIEGAVVL